MEFLVVCDVTKENPKIIEELNCAKVNVTHVSATSKNAADDKLRQRIRHFGETYPPGSTLVLITGVYICTYFTKVFFCFVSR